MLLGGRTRDRGPVQLFAKAHTHVSRFLRWVLSMMPSLLSLSGSDSLLCFPFSSASNFCHHLSLTIPPLAIDMSSYRLTSPPRIGESMARATPIRRHPHAAVATTMAMSNCQPIGSLRCVAWHVSARPSSTVASRCTYSRPIRASRTWTRIAFAGWGITSWRCSPWTCRVRLIPEAMAAAFIIDSRGMR